VQPGQIEPYEVTSLHAKVAGFVERIDVDIGDTVRAGDVLAQLALPEVVAERAQKTAAVELAAAKLRQQEANQKVAAANREAALAKVDESTAATSRADAEVQRRTSELARTEQLVAEGAVTSALVDEMRSTLAAAKAVREEVDAQVRSAQTGIKQADAGIEQAHADLAAAQANVAVAEADRARVDALLEYAKIVAPFDGVVRSRLVHPGHLTSPDGGGEPLLVITRADKVRVVVAVPEMLAAFVDVGDPVEIRLQSSPGTLISGSVSRTSGSLDDATRTLRAEIDVQNPAVIATGSGTQAGPRLRPGLYATTTIVAESHPDAIAVPTSAVVREPSGKSVCFVIEGGTLRRREVIAGLEEGGLVEIVSGLAGNDRLVAPATASLVEGQAVQVAP
jgi:RND family efflux transporter MFP subunit